MKKFLKWFIVIVIIVAITMVYFTIAQADEPSHQSQKSQIQNLRQGSLEMWKHLRERKKEDLKKTVLFVNTELEKKLEPMTKNVLKIFFKGIFFLIFSTHWGYLVNPPRLFSQYIL